MAIQSNWLLGKIEDNKLKTIVLREGNMRSQQSSVMKEFNRKILGAQAS
jgi:hypothetical protein